MYRKCLFYAAFVLVFVMVPFGARAAEDAPRGLGVSVENLPGELKGVDIKDHYIPAAQQRVGVVHALRGHVVIIHKKTGQAFFGKEGDVLYENDGVTTLSDTRCRIRFFNEDVVTMAPDTSFSVDSFQDQRAQGKKRSFFSMLKGKAMFYALRIFKYRDTRFSLKTPTAVIGVRGTKFGAHVYWGGEGEKKAGLQVADTGNSPGPYLAQVNPEGMTSHTDCFSEDGVLDVNGRTVNPGEMFRGDLGAVVPTPPDYARTFAQETEVPSGDEGAPGEGGEGEEGEGEGEKKAKEKQAKEAVSEVLNNLIESGGETETVDIGVFSEKALETTQQTVVSQTESATGTEDISQGKILGEYGGIALLLAKTDGVAWAVGITKGPIYTPHDPIPYTGGAETHVAYEERHDDNPDYKLVAQEQDAEAMDLQVNELYWGSNYNLAGNVTTKHTFEYTRGDRYYYQGQSGEHYLEWGWWEDTSGTDKGLIGMSATGDKFYAATQKIWIIEGQMTHPDYIDYLQQQKAAYTYTGEAKGVFADSVAAHTENLTGTFSTDVNFGTRALSNFNINVSGGGVIVNLECGTGKIDSDATFDIKFASGTMDGIGIDTNNSGAGGIFFGRKAEGIGGIWNALDQTGQHWATGEFHGHR